MDDIEGDAFNNDEFGASSGNLQATAPDKKKKTASETYTKVVSLATESRLNADMSF